MEKCQPINQSIQMRDNNSNNFIVQNIDFCPRERRKEKKEDKVLKDNKELQLLCDLARVIVGPDSCMACSFDDTEKRLLISGNNFGLEDNKNDNEKEKEIIELIKSLQDWELKKREEENYQIFFTSILKHLKHRLGSTFNKDDLHHRNLLMFFFRGIDPSNVAKFVNASISESDLKFITKFVEGFDRITADKDFLSKLREYGTVFIHNDHLGVHCEVKIMDQLLRLHMSQQKGSKNIFSVGTNLKTCAHCEIIYDLYEEHFKNSIKFLRRTSHGYFYNFTKKEYVPEMIQFLKLEQEYDQAKKNKIKVKKNYLDSSNYTKFMPIGSDEYKKLILDEDNIKIISKFVFNSEVLPTIISELNPQQLEEVSNLVTDRLEQSNLITQKESSKSFITKKRNRSSKKKK